VGTATFRALRLAVARRLSPHVALSRFRQNRSLLSGQLLIRCELRVFPRPIFRIPLITTFAIIEDAEQLHSLQERNLPTLCGILVVISTGLRWDAASRMGGFSTQVPTRTRHTAGATGVVVAFPGISAAMRPIIEKAWIGNEIPA
jgi:hypothetical protein